MPTNPTVDHQTVDKLVTAWIDASVWGNQQRADQIERVLGIIATHYTQNVASAASDALLKIDNLRLEGTL